jgi:hypothetical protein
MFNKTIFFNQSAGIGDIFFLIKASTIICNLGYNIVWPLKKEIFYIKDYLITHKNLTFIKEGDNFNFSGDYIIIDFQNADKIFDGSLLIAKYKLLKNYGLDIDYKDWNKYLILKRNIEKENDLFYNVLNLKDGEEYAVYNRHYGTPPYVNKKNNMKTSMLKKVEINIKDNFTVFDWLKVIENASEIHIVDSSLTYLIENLTLKAKDDKLHLYSRYTEEVGNPKWFHAADLFKKQWFYEDL